ncbi:MAG: AAA family ATPase, partial [Atribacterota bacterium]
MRLRKIVFKNYRQFKNTELVLEEPRTYDIHLVIGKNGTGKTNLLNAINWCLYGEEFHLHLDSQKLPLYNTAAEGNHPQVTVEVWLSQEEDGKKIGFVRERKSTDQAWVMIERSGGFESYTSWETFKMLVSRFIPEDINSFFFFDGESLDTYFRNFQAVQGKINQLARINVLEEMKKNFGDLLKDFSKGTDVTGELEATYKKIEELECRLAECNKRIEELQNEKAQLEEDIRNLEEELRGQPDVRELDARLKKL